jgi:hypothetical protein
MASLQPALSLAAVSKGADMVDVLIILLTAAIFALSFAMVEWLDRI